jgi:3-dehydroquinate dehydratase-1
MENRSRKIKKWVVPGKPIICVPIMAQTRSELTKQVNELTKIHVPMIEWRMDWYDQLSPSEAIDVLSQLSEEIRNAWLLCTFRSKIQGGQTDLTESAYLELLQTVAQSGETDFVDFEFFRVENPEFRINMLKQFEVGVIGSHHNFARTPSIEEMEHQFEAMLLAGCDIAKLAVMPNEKLDVINLMTAVQRTKAKFPLGQIAAMSMGEMGKITRLLGEWFGSVITFGFIGTASAPGQLPFEELESFLETFHHLTGEDADAK